MISRPLVAGTLAGWLFGEPGTGLLLGGVLEMIYLDALPVGAARFPDCGLAAVVGCGTLAIAGRHGLETGAGVWLLALMLALLTGLLGGMTIAWLRRRNAWLPARTLADLERGKMRSIEVHQFLGLASSFARGVVVTAVAAPLSLVVVRGAGVLLSGPEPAFLVAGRSAILCASLALGIRFFVSGRPLVYFVLGAGLTLTFLGIRV